MLSTTRPQAFQVMGLLSIFLFQMIQGLSLPGYESRMTLTSRGGFSRDFDINVLNDARRIQRSVQERIEALQHSLDHDEGRLRFLRDFSFTLENFFTSINAGPAELRKPYAEFQDPGIIWYKIKKDYLPHLR